MTSLVDHFRTKPRQLQMLRDADGNPTPEKDTRYVSPTLLGEYLGCHRATVFRLLQMGRLPQSAVMRKGGLIRPRYYYCPAAVYAWLKEHGAHG